MRKKLCLGFGFALIGIAALLFVAGISSDDDPSYRIVQNDEAKLIVGGGESGQAYTYVYSQCGGVAIGCSSTGGYSPTGPGTQKAGSSQNCGAASCGAALATVKACDE